MISERLATMGVGRYNVPHMSLTQYRQGNGLSCVIITLWSKQMPAIFPFTAIVGQERMKRALILNAVDTRIGGVLIRGERGTAKSTAARALAALLPHVKVVQDCRFGCDPDKPATWCTECKERVGASEKLPIARTRHIRSSTCPSPPPKTAWSARSISKKPSRRVNVISSRACWPRQPRPALHRRSQPARRSRGGCAARLGGDGRQHRRTRRHFLRPPGPLHPRRDDESRRRRSAPAAAGSLRPLGGHRRHPRGARTCDDHGAQPGLRSTTPKPSASSGCRKKKNSPSRSRAAANWWTRSPTPAATCSPSPR